MNELERIAEEVIAEHRRGKKSRQRPKRRTPNLTAILDAVKRKRKEKR